MYFVGLISFCYVIVTTAAAAAAAASSGLNSRSVNVNLETVLEFDPKDNSGDVQFLDNIQEFLGKVRSVIDSKTVRRYHRKLKGPKTEKFTDFIKKVIEILKTYSDDDLEDVVAVVDNETRKYHYKGCKFHELVQNVDLRRYVASKLSTVQNKQGKDIKKSLNNILDALDDSKFDYKQVQLLDYINSLYRHTDANKMDSFLNEIQAYAVKSKRTDLSLLRIIQNGIRNLVFDHYSNLNPNARRELRFKIESFWSRDKETVPTTEATTRRLFDIANGFNFLRDFTFEFVTPDTYTKKTTAVTKKEEIVDETNEDMPNYTADEESKEKKGKKDKENKKVKDNKKDKENKKVKEKKKDKKKKMNKDNKMANKKSKNNEKKDKTEKKKTKEYKRKKTNYRARVTVIDDDMSSSGSKGKHKGDHVFRQHEEPSNVFDYTAVINVKGQSDESHSSEVWKPNESNSFERHKTSKKKIKDYRKNIIAPKSEEGLSIDFKPSPINLSINNEHTTKVDETLLRRLNNLEKVVEIFKTKVNRKDNNEINVTPVKIIGINQSPTTKQGELAALANNNCYPNGGNAANQEYPPEQYIRQQYVPSPQEYDPIPPEYLREKFLLRDSATTKAYKNDEYMSTTEEYVPEEYKSTTVAYVPRVYVGLPEYNTGTYSSVSVNITQSTEKLNNITPKLRTEPSGTTETNKTIENNSAEIAKRVNIQLLQKETPKLKVIDLKDYHNAKNTDTNTNTTNTSTKSIVKLNSYKATSMNAVSNSTAEPATTDKTTKYYERTTDKNERDDNANKIDASTSVINEDSKMDEVREKLKRDVQFFTDHRKKTMMRENYFGSPLS